MLTLKKQLHQGNTVLGTMLTEFYSPHTARILQRCGFDFFVIDCEHGAFDYAQVATIIAVGRGVDIPILVRVPEIRRECILKYLELGAQGLLIPQTETVEQVEDVIAYAKYAPLGNRGVSLSRPHTDFAKVDGQEYTQRSNEETFILLQIETRLGVDNITDLLAVSGVDAVLIGPNDLSQSLGLLGEYDHPEFVTAISQVVQAAQQQNSYSGMHIPDLGRLADWHNQGMRVLMWNSELGMMMAEAKRGLQVLRGYALSDSNSGGGA